MDIYTTIQGDTWDMISYKVYGSSKYIGLLMKNNYDLLDIFIFSAGIEINVPELQDSELDDIPEWRK